MPRLFALLLALLLLPATAFAQTAAVTVVHVVDGDTVDVLLEDEVTIERLRLIGLDTPETKHPELPVQCFGQEASARATELLLGQVVTEMEADRAGGLQVRRNGRMYLPIPDLLKKGVWRVCGAST